MIRHNKRGNMLRINNLKQPLDVTEAKLKSATAAKLKCKPADLRDFRISKKSVDARNKQNVHFVLALIATLHHKCRQIRILKFCHRKKS